MLYHNQMYECDISLNKTVILQRYNVLKAVKLQPNKLIVFEKLRFKPEKAVGLPFGTIFEVKNGELHQVEKIKPEEKSLEAGEDNRCLTDTHGESQNLKRLDLIQMKDEGATGEEIVQSLVENSSSYAEKTVFSQKKYLQKKKRKYFPYLQILKPTSRLICKLYQEREPSKICNMRVDSVSQIMTAANIKSSSKVAVFETCSGVVLGSILERLGGEGSIVNLHCGETPANLFAVSYFNFPDSYWEKLHSLPLYKLAPLLAGKSFRSTFPDNGDLDIDEDDTSSSVVDVVKTRSENSTGLIQSSNGDVTNGSLKRKMILSEEEKTQVRLTRQRRRYKHQSVAWDLLRSNEMDALIVVSRFHPTPIVLALLKTLALSKPFAVYFEYKEPLMELFVRLSMSGIAINLQLTETFTRQYQVLPERTHPRVMMAGNTGYLLTGIKVQSNN